jgi:hypothetical protein
MGSGIECLLFDARSLLSMPWAVAMTGTYGKLPTQRRRGSGDLRATRLSMGSFFLGTSGILDSSCTAAVKPRIASDQSEMVLIIEGKTGLTVICRY